jgi:hypothetical protein
VKPHLIGEDSVLHSAVGVLETVFCESYAKELRKIPLADNIV